MDSRGVSPVVGVILMVALTLVLASMIAVSLPAVADLDLAQEQSDDLLDGEDPVAGDSSTTTTYDPWDGALVPAKDPGAELQTNDNENVLEFDVKNTRGAPVTVVEFAVDATGIEEGIVIDDGNDREFDVMQKAGKANNDSSDPFATDGTWYHVVKDSDDGKKADIGADEDAAEIDIRAFDSGIGEHKLTESKSDADVIVKLGLEDGATSQFYFKAV